MDRRPELAFYNGDMQDSFLNSLLSQIDFLKNENLHKNIMISSLIEMLGKYESKSNSNDFSLSNTVFNKDSDLTMHKDSTRRDNTLNDLTTNTICNGENDVSTPHVDEEFITVRRGKRKHTKLSRNIYESEKIISPNRFAPLEAENNCRSRDKEDINVQTENAIETSYKSDNVQRRPSVVIDRFPERNKNFKYVRPGIKNYNEAVIEGKPTVIFTTSIAKGIRVRDFNYSLGNGTAKVVRFHGAKANKFSHYIVPTLIEEQPKSVILQFGGNDLATTRVNPSTVESIAASIVEAAELCRRYGVRDIFIGSVTTRRSRYMDKRRVSLNLCLKDLCNLNNYAFIDNDMIGHGRCSFK